MGMILRIASSRIVGQGDIVGRSGYFSLNLSANSVMRGRLDARRTLKSLVADLRSNTKLALWLFTRELSERLKTEGITVNAADPGIVSTNIIRMDMWFDPLTDILFRPCIRTPKQGAATAVSLLLDDRWKEVTGQMFASCKPKKVKDKFMNHPQARQLWADTKAYLEKLKLEEPIV